MVHISHRRWLEKQSPRTIMFLQQQTDKLGRYFDDERMAVAAALYERLQALLPHSSEVCVAMGNAHNGTFYACCDHVYIITSHAQECNAILYIMFDQPLTNVVRMTGAVDRVCRQVPLRVDRPP